MSYDYGLKKISKFTGLTGIEAKNIATAFKTKNLDVETVDWETIGGDLYGHGSRAGGVKHHLSKMYGIDLSTPQTSKHEGQMEHASLSSLMSIHERRSRASKRMDLKRSAKGTFKHTDEKGVKIWKKYPNRFDIIGIDDPIIF